MAAMLEEQNNKNYLHKNKTFSQWKGILLFFSSSMAAANTLYIYRLVSHRVVMFCIYYSAFHRIH